MKLFEISVGKQVLEYSDYLETLKLSPRVHDAMLSIGANLFKMGFEWHVKPTYFKHEQQFVYPDVSMGNIFEIGYYRPSSDGGSWAGHRINHRDIRAYSENELEEFFK